MKNKRYIYGLLSGIGAEVLFGFSFLFSKDTLNKVPALSLLSWRFILAFIVMTICCRTGLIKVNFRGKSLRPLFRLALFHPILYFIGETIGVKLTTASESGTIIAIIPIATLILSALILKEKPGKFQVAGIIITFIGGFVIVLLQGVNLSLNIVGYIMLFIAVFAYSLFSIFYNRETSYTNEEKTYVMLFS